MDNENENENENEDEESLNFKDEKDLNNFLEILSPFINDYLNFNEKDYKIDSETKTILLNIFEKLHFIHQLKLKIYYPKLHSFPYPTIKNADNYVYTKKGDNKNSLYYYCTSYSANCPASLIIELNKSKGDLKSSFLKIFQSGIHNILIDHHIKKKIDLYQNAIVEITSQKDVKNYIKNEIALDPQANPYTIEKKLFSESKGKLGIYPKSNSINQDFKYLHKSIKLSDYDMLVKSFTKDNHKFFRRFHEDDDNNKFCLFASDLQLSHLDKTQDQIFIDGYFKVPNPFYQLITIYTFIYMIKNMHIMGQLFKL